MDDQYSSHFEIIAKNDCKPVIQSVIHELQKLDIQNTLDTYLYGEYSVIGFRLKVSLPSRGPVNDIDIRPLEPILLFIHNTSYPGRAPQIRIDRRSFPTDRLPHLNPVWPGEPPWLCLHRGSIDDWYAEHSIIDLINRARSWLEDAARERLIKEHDRFEPTRISPEYWVGTSVFDQGQFQDYITDQWKIHRTGGVAYVASHMSIQKYIDIEWFRLSSNDIASSLDQIVPIDSTNDGFKKKPGCLEPGLLLWPNITFQCTRYFGTLPRTVDELNEFAESIGIHMNYHLSSILATRPPTGNRFVPVFLCVKRPLKLIGSESNLEILSFICHYRDANNPVQTMVLPHRNPLTPDSARNISGINFVPSLKTILIGCGALGSKIGLHLARAGITELTLVDDDFLSPHNLIRHALTDSSLGMNKAEALKNVIHGLYGESPQTSNTVSISKNIFELLNNSNRRVLNDHSLLIDATASISVFRSLIEPNSNGIPRIVRCELADKGRLGTMLVEGQGRSPHLGDLRACLYDSAIENVHVQQWLQRFINSKDDQLEAGLEDITIGIGCSSPSMRVSDDLISYHASTQSVYIRKILSNTFPAGGILMSVLEGEELPLGSVQFYPVNKFKELIPHRSNGWHIRIRIDLFEQLIQQTKEAIPNEIGGILLGFVSEMQKTIYITRLVEAPIDSENSPYMFKLGIRDVPEQISDIMKKTGNLIRYVGEWHSHPKGSSSLSPKDMETVQHLRKNLKKIAMPTLVVVVTPHNCYPHLFSS
jgi:proteasome lid subunit RPN8/RPN11